MRKDHKRVVPTNNVSTVLPWRLFVLSTCEKVLILLYLLVYDFFFLVRIFALQLAYLRVQGLLNLQKLLFSEKFVFFAPSAKLTTLIALERLSEIHSEVFL